MTTLLINQNPHELAKIILHDLSGSGMSFSRIAKRIGVSSSTVQKLMTTSNRVPRESTIIKLVLYYQKIFSTPRLYGSKVMQYYSANSEAIQQFLELLKQDIAFMPHVDGF